LRRRPRISTGADTATQEAKSSEAGASRSDQAEVGHNQFDRVSIEAPFIEVDTTDGYEPELDTIVAFVSSGRT
jgi:hypothetical protein